MGRTVKRFISTLIAAAMIISAVPVIAAETAENSAQARAEDIEKKFEENMSKLMDGEAGQSEEKAEKKTRDASSSVTYISTPEELAAIKLDGGTYALTQDIDISDSDWKPIVSTDENAKAPVILGEGYTISGMTVTAAETDFQSGHAFAGLIYDADVYDLTLDNVNIDIDTNGALTEVSPLGMGTAENCAVDGTVNVNASKNDVYLYTYVCGIYRGTNCSFSGNINASCAAYGIYDSKESEFNGSIVSDTACGIYNSAESEFNGSIAVNKVSDNSYGICGSTDCVFNGYIKGAGNAAGIGSKNDRVTTRCEFNGDILCESASYGIYSSYKASDSEEISVSDCIFRGDINTGIGISGASDCVMTGNIQSGGTGITYSENCFMTGNINGVGCGIACSKDCYLDGNIRYEGYPSLVYGDFPWQNGRNHRMAGISFSNDCYMSGDITVTTYGEDASSIVIGIDGGNGCCLVGNVTLNTEDNYMLNWSLLPDGDGAFSQGICGGTDCFMIGDVSARCSQGAHARAYGFGLDDTMAPSDYSYSRNCYIDGNIYANSLATAWALGSHDDWDNFCGGDSDCYISGLAIASSPKESVSASFGNVSYGTAEAFTVRADMRFDKRSGTPEVTPDPTPPEAHFSLQIIDEVKQRPIPYANVSLDGAEYTVDENGVVANVKGIPLIEVISVSDKDGKPFGSKENYRAIPNQMNAVYVSQFNIDKDDFNFGNPGGDAVKGPPIEIKGKKYPAFELPGAIDVNLLEAVRVAYDPDEKAWRVILGGSDADLQDLRDGDYTPAFAKKYQEVKEFWEKLTKNQLNEKEFKKYNTPQKKDLGWKTSVAISGFLELKLSDNGDMLLTNGGIVTAASVGMSGSYPLPNAPYVYLTYSLSGSLQSEMKLSLDSATIVDPTMKVTSTISFDAVPSVGTGIGAKNVLAFETGLSGKIHTEVSFPFDTMPNSFKAELSADYYFMLKALIFEARYSHTFIKWPMYPPGDVELMSVDESDFTPISRDYLNAPTLAADDTDTMKQNIYTYSTVNSVTLDDGRELMVWLDDDTARNDANRTALFYRILKNGTWSETKQIENDGTADFDFDLRANGNEAVIVWQDANTRLADTASLEDAAKSVDISYAKFDGENWSAPVSVTSGNSNYEYSPMVASDEYESYIIWTQNNLNSTMPGVDDTTESIYRARINEYGRVENSEMIYDDIPLLYGSAVDANGNAAYIADVDGDVTTPENRFYVSDKSYGGGTVLSGLQYTGREFAFTEDGALKTADAYGSQPVTQCSLGADSIAYITDNYGNIGAAVYEVQDGFTSNLYASYYDNYGWTNPVPITDFDEKIRSWDAYLDNDGNIVLSAALAKINVDGDNLTDSVRLVHTKTEPIEDIETITVYPEGDVVRGRNAQFVVDVANNTTGDITTANVTLKCGDTVLYGGETNVNLIAGETTSINISAPIPDGFTGGTITASVSVPDLTEADTGNNSAQTTVGGAKLSVELKGNQIFSGGYAQAVIENVSCEDVSNAALTVTGENGDEIYSETIDSIAAGETKRVKIELDEKYYTFTDDYDSFAVKASVKYGENKETDTYRIKPQSVIKVNLDEKSIVLKPSESYKINAGFCPAGTSADIYVLSSDESVVTTDGETITAVGEGSAAVTVMAVGAIMSAKLTVYVRNLAAPVITSAQTTDYSDMHGDVEVTVDTSACLAEGETEKLIVAAYAEDGSLLGVKTNDIQASEDNAISISVSGKKPKYIKAMLWSSLSGMKPAALAARYDLPE